MGVDLVFVAMLKGAVKEIRTILSPFHAAAILATIARMAKLFYFSLIQEKQLVVHTPGIFYINLTI